ncbi:hypothetical protein HPB50_016097 [Hyalomma asiaticum]|uniref:Uncharacterized protein n=1 Tax=Hyalomma asiaticum TaxID=266040 RepID=A0ACB7T5A9_HYAAI|nr:hypothetical protein HPB50_016097 [Hyalomma asiaticum]
MAGRGSTTTPTRNSKAEVQLGNTPMTNVNFLSEKTVYTTAENSLSSTVFVDVNGYVRLHLVFLNMAVTLLGLLGFWSSLYAPLTTSSHVPGAPSRNFVVVLFQRPETAAFSLSSVVIVTASFGFLGALRENVTLLTVYVRQLTAFAVLQVLAAVLVFFRPSAARSYMERSVSRDMIAAYHDYPDLQSFVDWMQLEYRCCAVSSEGFRDWNHNAYFACNETNVSRERCFVPASCCRRNETNAGRLPNVMCGMNVLQVSDQVAWTRVYTRSCSDALFSRVQDHVFPASMIALALCLLTLLLAGHRHPRAGASARRHIRRLLQAPGRRPQEVMEARNTSGFRMAKARRANREEEPPAFFWGLLSDKWRHAAKDVPGVFAASCQKCVAPMHAWLG